MLSIDSSCKDPDWLYVRTASMVRKIYIRKGMGVGDLAIFNEMVTFCWGFVVSWMFLDVSL